jgi:hypothetical protein
LHWSFGHAFNDLLFSTMNTCLLSMISSRYSRVEVSVVEEEEEEEDSSFLDELLLLLLSS